MEKSLNPNLMKSPLASNKQTPILGFTHTLDGVEDNENQDSLSGSSKRRSMVSLIPITQDLKMNQSNICEGFVLPNVELNSETFASALVYMIADCNLPFEIFEHKSFQDLIHLLKELVMPLVKTTSQAAIATHTTSMYHLFEEMIKESYLAKQISMSSTQDAWTSPNVTVFMEVTAHFVEETFQMHANNWHS
ncbi:hypothetical protein VP01_1245g2 [Puccinia sorghi]|uniref:Uncharacterized protein n=1 Tax=Puccinia sorghi TaxID=27349 RepID=A0A0L6VPJ1_9BASI|nr:hypothetical protein VP01_1245g2 [Puccinia sorghi]